MIDRWTEQDVAFMKRALTLAGRGQGRVEPNPMVGCVLVRRSRIVAEGYHRRYGGPHAEIEALRRVSHNSRGTTAYVTLEPCCHRGKTGPCADALIEAGIARVVAAMKDPFPQVAGRGLKRLRRAGLQVAVGLCREQAVELNAPYLTLTQRGRPYVILKWAQSIDGRIATRTGDSRWISGSQSRRWVHRLRARVDGVLVGIGTALIDDPSLMARDVPLRRKATRIVLDTHLRLPPKSQLVATAGQVPLLVLTSRAALRTRPRRAQALRRKGVELETCRLSGGVLDLADVLQRLGRCRLTNLLVEGGGQVFGSLLDRGLADEAYVFVAPKLIGGAAAVSAYPGLGTTKVADGPSIVSVTTTRSGHDLLYRLRFDHL